MGNCCPAESPCGSAEERIVLLNDETKAMVSSGEIVPVSTGGAEKDEDTRNTSDETNKKAEEKAETVQDKHRPLHGETEPNNTQENGPLQKEGIQPAMPSPHKESGNSTRPQDEGVKKLSHDSGQAEHLQCTLDPQQKDHAAEWEVLTAIAVVPKEETPGSVQDRIIDGGALTAEAVHPQHLSCTEATTAREHNTRSTAHDNEEEAAAGSRVATGSAIAEPSEESLKNNQMSNAQLATAADHISSISVVSQEISEEIPSFAVSNAESSSVCKQADPEDANVCDVSESCPGSEPTALGHSAEGRDSANSVSQQETRAAADASESLKSDQDAKLDSGCTSVSVKALASLENIKHDTGKVLDQDGDVSIVKEEDVMQKEEAETKPGKDAETQEGTNVKAEVMEAELSAEDDLGNSEEDLYRGAEELSVSQNTKPGPPPVLESTKLKMEDRCSLAPAVDILSYSEREWKGNTAKSALIRKGYKEMSQRFASLRRVRGDNYCALRAVLFQVLSHSTQLPVWLQENDITKLLKQLEAQEGLISLWTFPGECLQGDGTEDANQQLKHYVELLRNKWQAAVECSSAVERQQLCERAFQGGEEELGLLEALKLLMLGRAVELHSCMRRGRDVPLFCLLLFARDSSDCPRSFLSNHLSHVGQSAGLEQVEMFLLGYALQCTIQVYRLYKADTEEFVTYYPDDHKNEWPSICLVTEDDRHYNVPVVEAAALHKELKAS
uniref:OTU domain-containing protein n=1 Tax=Monopterus albus TaxID=43700 RepID=A0A3Q3K596_MONAL|nr:ubiquitin thioesterase otulin [Monopterus albus]XP_020475409.1 ubiquitin thioesterase otulin [Monopterus albus]XP_020475410.1 ubiquitin thioesterase otulin [Monopterus albus]